MEIYHALMESHALDAGIALQCRHAPTIFHTPAKFTSRKLCEAWVLPLFSTDRDGSTSI